MVNRTASNPAAAPAATFAAESSTNTVRSGRRPNRSRQQREDPRVRLGDADLARDQHVLEQPDRGRRRLGEVERLGRPVGEAEQPDAERAQVAHQLAPTPAPARRACRRSARRTGPAPAGARARSRRGPPARPPTDRPASCWWLNARKSKSTRNASTSRAGSRPTNGPARVPPDEDVAEVEHDRVDHPRSAGSSWTRTVPPSRRALRTASDAASARASARRWRAARGRGPGRPARARPCSAASTGTGPEDLGVGEVEPGQQGVDGVARAGDRGDPHGGRQGQLGALGELARGVPGRVPAHERLRDPLLGVADEHDRPAVGRRTHQRGSRQPPAQRVLPGPQRRPGGAHGGVQQQRGGVPARARPARRPASRRRPPGRPATVAEHAAGRAGTGDADRAPRGTRGRAPRRSAPSRPGPTAARPPRTPCTASRWPAARTSRTWGRRRPWSARADRGTRRSAPPPGTARTRPRARSRRGAPARGPGRRASRSRSVRHAGAGSRAAAAGPSRASSTDVSASTRAARVRASSAGRRRPRAPSPTRRAPAPRRCARARPRAARTAPARSAAPAPRGRAGTALAARRAAGRRRPTRRRARGRVTGANADARVPTTTDAWPRSAARNDRYRAAGPSSAASRTAPPVDPGVQRGTPAAVQRAEHAVDVPRVGHHDERTPPAQHARGDRLRDRVGPPLARGTGQGGPHRARRAAGGDVLQERRSAAVRRPRGGRRATAVAGASDGRGDLGLHPGVPRRDGEPQHVVQRARPPVRDRPRQPGDLRREHRLGGDDLAHRLRARRRARPRRRAPARSR